MKPKFVVPPINTNRPSEKFYAQRAEPRTALLPDRNRWQMDVSSPLKPMPRPEQRVALQHQGLPAVPTAAAALDQALGRVTAKQIESMVHQQRQWVAELLSADSKALITRMKSFDR